MKAMSDMISNIEQGRIIFRRYSVRKPELGPEVFFYRYMRTSMRAYLAGTVFAGCTSVARSASLSTSRYQLLAVGSRPDVSFT